MRITWRSRGDWRRTKKYLKKLSDEDYFNILDKAAMMGVEALEAATPKDSGVTASSWEYHIVRGNGNTMIEWVNTNVVSGWFNVAIALQYGHGTGTGGYVEGYDYINPAIAPVFDKISQIVWEVVKSS